MSAGLIAALDSLDPARVAGWAEAVAPHCGLLKLGLEFFLAQGQAGVRGVGHRPVFLDLKLHDIPNTVAGAVRAVLPCRPAMLTLHASGGGAMLEAARRAVEEGGPGVTSGPRGLAAGRDRVTPPDAGAATHTPEGSPPGQGDNRVDGDRTGAPVEAGRPLLLAVTVLTSLDAEALHGVGVAGGPRQQVLRLARLAMASGMDGMVCAAAEVAPLRDALGAGPVLVVPGIRPSGAAVTDQRRAATPAEAVAAGADWLVVGRPITGAPDPAAAARAVLAEMRAAG